MKTLDSIENRRSIRNFSNKKVSLDKIIELIDAANQSPFAGNINNLKFIIISEKETKEKLSEYCQQSFVSHAPFIIVVCAETQKLINHYDEIGLSYSKHQVGSAIQNLLLRATDLKLATCWIGSFVEEQIKRKLKIPEKYDVEALIPIGYSSKKETKKPRKIKVDKKIFWENWGTKKKPTNYKEPATW